MNTSINTQYLESVRCELQGILGRCTTDDLLTLYGYLKKNFRRGSIGFRDVNDFLQDTLVSLLSAKSQPTSPVGLLFRIAARPFAQRFRRLRLERQAYHRIWRAPFVEQSTDVLLDLEVICSRFSADEQTVVQQYLSGINKTNDASDVLG